MARILVADDNSNIQKMVGLALKDQGIDVVAVGNGEAAVRKISDIRPDLVLADVFMPVRNGYEVCQYVKSDSTLAHIPVILLVGAFDPLDEQEAQRVGADGVLKKPFVPPDPLISMVKSALARAGVPVGGAPVAAPVHEDAVRVTEMLTPKSAPSTRGLPSMPSPMPMQELPSVDEPVEEEMPAMPEPVKIDAGSQPLAFGNLLESPVAEPEEDLGYATTARPELERDWKSGDKEDEVEEEQEGDQHSASWRRDAGGESMEEEQAPSGAEKDWRETAFAEAPARKMRDDSWAPQKEISAFQEAAESQQSIGAMVTDAPVAETSALLPAIAPFPEAAWVTALRANPTVETATLEASGSEPLSPPIEEQQVAAEVAHVPSVIPAGAPAQIEAAPEPEKPAGSSWFSSVPSPWDAEVQKASSLASTWGAPSEPAARTGPATVVYAGEHAETAKQDPSATVDALPSVLSEEARARAEEAALPAATVEAIREEAQHVAETAVQEAPAAETSAKAQEPSMEDLVAKVLARMSPDMLQAVTRDILKNVVESMVRDELNAKKQ